MDKIDFVITWVDEKDTRWKNDRKKYFNEICDNSDNSDIRFRDWEILKYWFRGVEKYASWVNKIYFITYGHVPKWLNLNNKKLVIVNHRDYIPKEYLPTFNSDAIEMNMYKIPGLSDKFVYFNDDMFITNYVKKEDFFLNGLPCDSLILSPIIVKPNDDFYKKICNNMLIINSNFNFKENINKNKRLYLSFKYNKYLLKNIPLMIYDYFPGFNNFHLPISYLKSTFEDVWNKERKILQKTMSYRFRNNSETINHWIFQYWQFALGKFIPRNPNIGRFFKINDNDLLISITNNKYKMICINDFECEMNYEKRKKQLIESFEKILPDKSSFEK